MEPGHEESAVEYVWQEGEIVWAKITGHPWWPALVTQVPSLPDDHIRVDFFADNSHAFLSASKLAPYEDYRQSIDMHRHMVRGLRKAVLEADKVHRAFPVLRKDPCKVRRAVSSPSTHPQQLMHATLQQNNKLSQPESAPAIPSPTKTAPAEPESEQQSLPPPQPAPVTYSKHQRERYVATLLKKYQLSVLPRLGRKEESQQKQAPVPRQPKTKHIRKQARNAVARQDESHLKPDQQLARKLQRMLVDKRCGSGEQCRTISLSLTRQVLAGSDSRENFLRLAKWLQISAASTVQCYYQSWAGLHSDKDKASTMTHEQ